MTDRRIQAAKRAELEAFVESNGTDGDRTDLALSSLAGANMKFGFSLRDLVAAAADGKGVSRNFEYEASKLAELAARIKLRQELRLPSRECVVRKPPPEADHCLCLSEAIDAVIASGQRTSRDEILKAARREHGETWAWLRRKPKPRPVPPAHAPPREAPKTRPAPLPAPAAAVTDTSTRPARVIKRSPKWFDPQPRSVRDMQF
jgi:hypothetical protein